jgi:hypothetical protein
MADCRQTIYRCVLAAAVVALALASAGPARAVGGNPVFSGGTSAERAEVRRALEVSRFDWDLVPAQIRVHIAPGQASHATRGEIWLDADLLDADTFGWGVVQHEYAHQVDFFLLDDADRAFLAQKLGAEAWCSGEAVEDRENLGCERFASTLAWAYWSSPLNCLRPEHAGDEAAALPPAQFRALVSRLIVERALLRAHDSHRLERGL